LRGIFPGNPDGTQDVMQRIYDTDGSYTERLAGKFIYHPAHHHIHFEDWSEYRLRQILPGDSVGPILAKAEKVSFCILDFEIFNSTLPNYNPFGQFFTCSDTVQGLSVGWKDVYDKSLPGQDIDVTGIPDGVYWLESEVDPYNHILESNKNNNIARVKVTINTNQQFILDDDTDGVANACDNCEAVYNPQQLDGNADGVGDACDGKFHIESYSLPDAIINRPYSYQFYTVSGTSPFHWAIIGGDIPSGCTFNADTIGTLVGTPNYATTFFFTVTCFDSSIPAKSDTVATSMLVNNPPLICGDINHDQLVNISDPVFLISYIFGGGPAPDPYSSGDVNNDSGINLSDAVYLINYIFADGPVPCGN
jgi:hypothetical protein